MTNKEQKIEKNLLEAVHKGFKQVKASYLNYHNNPYKAEYIHRFRVDMRKMRTLLNFLKPLLNKEIYETFNQALRDLGKRLSPIRDLDTLIEECSKLALDEPQLIDNYADIFRFLEKERLKLIKSQSTKTAFKEFEGVLEGTEAILEGLTFQLDDDEESYEAFIEKRYQHKAKKFEEEYDKLNLADYNAVHEARKHAKKVRYASAGFKKVLPKKERKSVKKRAKKAQNHLGKITDVHVIIGILEDYKEKAQNQKVKKSFQKIINYHKAHASH